MQFMTKRQGKQRQKEFILAECFLLAPLTAKWHKLLLVPQMLSTKWRKSCALCTRLTCAREGLDGFNIQYIFDCCQTRYSIVVLSCLIQLFFFFLLVDYPKMTGFLFRSH